jgi:hypothetical protein
MEFRGHAINAMGVLMLALVLHQTQVEAWVCCCSSEAPPKPGCEGRHCYREEKRCCCLLERGDRCAYPCIVIAAFSGTNYKPIVTLLLFPSIELIYLKMYTHACFRLICEGLQDAHGAEAIVDVAKAAA